MPSDESTEEKDEEKEKKKEKKFRDTEADITKGSDIFTGKYKQYIDEVRGVYHEKSILSSIDEVGKRHDLGETPKLIEESHDMRRTPVKLGTEREDMLKEALKRTQLEDMHTERVKDSSVGVFGQHLDKIKSVYDKYREGLFSGLGSHAKPTAKSRLKYYRSKK